MPKTDEKDPLAHRFRGYLPVVIDVETGGFNEQTDALLEIGLCTLHMDYQGRLQIKESCAFDITPFEGANIEQAALDFTGINPDDPARADEDEETVLKEIFRLVRREIKESDCKRAVLVGHNASFDHKFLMAAAERTNIKRNPFHPFTTLDTAALSGLVYGHTVLAEACRIASIDYDNSKAHSAEYDTRVTAELFCQMTNQWQEMGGWDRTLEAQQRLLEKREAEKLSRQDSES